MSADPSQEPDSLSVRFRRSAQVQRRLHELVPAGAHTYSRGSDQYPEGLAPVLTHGSGARVWDVDGNEFVEYGMGLRSVTLGHGFAPIVDAVREAIGGGVNFSRPTVWELQAAEQFVDQVPTAEMVKFAKNGSDATTAAIKLSRAVTGRSFVAYCETQPFFSVDDWFIATTSMPAGTLDSDRRLSLGFRYNDLDGVERLFAEHGNEIACLILEPATALAEPLPGFLEGLREVTRRHGAVLIFDEMITGMRWAAAGAQSLYGVRPDLSTWGKAIGNGFSVSALAGSRHLMDLGGLRTSSSRAFLLSTTHGAEVGGLAAFLAVSRHYAEHDVVGTMERQGRRLADGYNALAAAAGLGGLTRAIGRPSCLVFTSCGPDGRPSQEYRTLLLQELLRGGVLGQSFVISAAHTDADVDHTLQAAEAALAVYAKAIDSGSATGFFRGRPVAPALRDRAFPRQID